ncbi:hypothetical protein QQ008_04745 [Fulvivirgaceae bacterium BMA10]|uniref:Uncharacterized protein n=1 Tax=Splendidivirga corallicola TaxID=3051826 RepID=A0ABT8KIW3_9BACT|nr:hypothetical protein [Fulvivirgaceae bacterium BMA10]
MGDRIANKELLRSRSFYSKCNSINVRSFPKGVYVETLNYTALYAQVNSSRNKCNLIMQKRADLMDKIGSFCCCFLPILYKLGSSKKSGEQLPFADYNPKELLIHCPSSTLPICFGLEEIA